MKITGVSELGQYLCGNDTAFEIQKTVFDIISEVRLNGFSALEKYSLKFDSVIPASFEVDFSVVTDALLRLEKEDSALFSALKFCRDNIQEFAELQKAQIRPFEKEIAPGVFAGQNVIPVSRAAIYVPRGRYPLISSVLMGVIPARAAGVNEICVVSAPLADGLPDKRVMAAAALSGANRVFALGGAQAIAAFAYGVNANETRPAIPRAGVIAGPGNKYVAEAKRQIYGAAGIDAIAGPTDVLVIADEKANPAFIAADLIAQAEHDTDARARILAPSETFAKKVETEVAKQLENLLTKETAGASLAHGIIAVYNSRDEAAAAANTIAPEHLELQTEDNEAWLPLLHNYGSIFIGENSAEVLGDYSAGINHTLPTNGASRFSGGLSVRNFLKIVTSLRINKTAAPYLEAAAIMAQAEGLAGHKASAEIRLH